MNWTITRGVIYIFCFLASGLAIAGLAEFDFVTGEIDIMPFNLYAVAGAIGGAISSLLATLALFKGWGRKLPESNDS